MTVLKNVPLKRCCDCKYTKGIGYDFWCGEGHTEYEVFGAETSCPYYEYHDWSKGTPTTKKTDDIGVCAEISTKRMYLILLKAQEMILENNTQYKKREIVSLLSSIEHDILMLNDKNNSISRDLFD